METIGAFTEEFTKDIKQRVAIVVQENGWTFDQIQYAEDYVDEISQGKTAEKIHCQRSRTTTGLLSHHSRVIRDIVRSRKASYEWRNNAWEQPSS